MSLPDNTQRSLGRMEGKMDSLLISIGLIGSSLATESAERKAADLGLEGRVRVLEDIREGVRGGLKMINVIWITVAGATGAAVVRFTGLLGGTG